MADRIDPCLRCHLPDCDDNAPDCGLRVALRRYYAHRRNNRPIPEEDRRAYSLAWREIYQIPWKDKKAAQRAAEQAGAL